MSRCAYFRLSLLNAIYSLKDSINLKQGVINGKS